MYVYSKSSQLVDAYAAEARFIPEFSSHPGTPTMLSNDAAGRGHTASQGAAAKLISGVADSAAAA